MTPIERLFHQTSADLILRIQENGGVSIWEQDPEHGLIKCLLFQHKSNTLPFDELQRRNKRGHQGLRDIHEWGVITFCFRVGVLKVTLYHSTPGFPSTEVITVVLDEKGQKVRDRYGTSYQYQALVDMITSWVIGWNPEIVSETDGKEGKYSVELPTNIQGQEVVRVYIEMTLENGKKVPLCFTKQEKGNRDANNS
jgi:hypothetical protein